MILTFRPIKVWPEGWREGGRRRTSSPFSASYPQTLNALESELRHLGATDALLQVAASPDQIRMDGQLRADARPSHPGVILTIETKKHGTLVYSTDRFYDWQSNLRAIALGLEALRRIERYGIADRGQQYAGYKELPTGIAVGKVMTVDEAARFLTEHAGFHPRGWSGLIGVDRVHIDTAYRMAAKKLHPDQGGDPDLFRRAGEARDLLLTQAASD